MKKIFIMVPLILLTLLLVGCSKETKNYATPSLINITQNENACKNLVIFIGDGMGPQHVKAGEIAYDKKFDFTSWNNSLSDTFSYDSFTDTFDKVTDSAAGGTAIATGVVTTNGYVGLNSKGEELATILDYAKSLGKSTGVLSTDTITGATPADFSAHAIDRSMTNEIINTQITSNIDLFIGEYSSDVEMRKNDIEKGGYKYYQSYESITDINKQDKAWCQFNFKESNGNESLKDAAEIATNFLSRNENGYVLMIEAAHIDKFSHNNDFESMIDALYWLNETINYIKSVSNNETAIIITADHETGLLEVSSEEIYNNKYMNAYYNYQIGEHSGTNVPLYVYGFDVDFKEFSMFDDSLLVKNSDIFKIELYAITGNKYTINE